MLTRKPSRSYRPQFETCEPRLLLTGNLDNDVMEVGTNLNFVDQEEHANLLSYPTGNANANGTDDRERRPFVFRNGVDWSDAYNFDANTGLSTTSPWRQEFLDDLNIYSQLRFIHWTNTNGSGIETWSQRTDPNSDQSGLSLYGTTNQGVNNGIAWEWLIDLGNRLGKDIWINIPMKADDAYVENLASLLNERLDPSLTVHVEYHNEVWLNKQMAGDTRSTNEYSSDMATAAGIQGSGTFDNVVRWYAHRSAQIWQTFRTEFGSSFDSRVVKVVAGQTANENVGEQMRNKLRDPSVNTTVPIELEDAYAIAPYFASIETITDPVDFDELNDLAQGQVAQALLNVDVWDDVGTPVIAYEGGQSITGRNASDESVLSINSDPRMKAIYLDYLEGLEDAGLESFNHFTHSGIKIAPSNNSDDAWGAKAYIGQPTSEAPKFAALAEFVGIEPIESNLIHDGAIAAYDAAGTPVNGGTALEPNAEWIDEVVVGDLVAGPGVGPTNGYFNNSFAPNGWDSTTLAQAISADEYISFPVSIAPGFELNVNALDAILRSQNQARNFALMSSATGFDEGSILSDFGGPIYGNSGEQAVTLDLDATAGLDGLTGTVEFRIYAYGGTPSPFQSVGIGRRDGIDLTLFGQVAELPSPILVDEVVGAFDTLGSLRLVTTEIEAENNVVPVLVSPIIAGDGVSATNSWYNNRFAPRSWQSQTLSAAIQDEDYLSFTVDVAEGYSLDLAELEAYLFTQNQRQRNFALLSSQTGFAVDQVLSDFGGTVTGASQYGQEERTASLDALSEITGSVEFRIYVYGPSNTNPWEAVGLGSRSGDELALTGTLTRIVGGPEVVYDGAASEFETTGSVKQQSTSIAADAGSALFTTSDLTPGPGLAATNGWYNNRFAPIGWNSSTLDQAIANDDYLAFNLTVAEGVSVDLTEIDAHLFTQNKKSRTFALLSDVAGFNSSSVLTDFGGAVTGSSNNGQESRVADLTAASLNDLTGTIEFRIYVYGSVNVWEAVGIGDRLGSDLKLSGQVTL